MSEKPPVRSGTGDLFLLIKKLAPQLIEATSEEKVKEALKDPEREKGIQYYLLGVITGQYRANILSLKEFEKHLSVIGISPDEIKAVSRARAN